MLYFHIVLVLTDSIIFHYFISLYSIYVYIHIIIFHYITIKKYIPSGKLKQLWKITIFNG